MKLKYCFLISIVVSAVLSLFFLLGVFSNNQLQLSDHLYGGKESLDNLIILAIDDKSLQEIGRWPWDRDVIAKAISLLDDAKVIGIDVAFFEKSMDDSSLVEAVNRTNVVLPIEFTSFEKKGDLVKGKELLYPFKELAFAKKGYINIITDEDGITRSVNLDLSDSEKSFSEIIYKNLFNYDLKEKPQRFLINFAGPPGSFKYVSISDVINKRISGSEFKDKIILIGAVSPDLHDNYIVPTSKGKAMPGVEIHANIVQNFINDDVLRNISDVLVIILIFLFSLSISLSFYKFRIRISTMISIVFILFYIFSSIFLFSRGIILNLVYIPLSIVLTYFTMLAFFYSKEKKARKELKNAFSKYVSPAVVDEILENPETLKLGGIKKEITVFFSDIRSFTTISEKLSPEKLVHLLNEYLTAMTDIIMKHEGVVDKFIGDAIMAFWGAPLKQPDHAEKACLTSLDMIKSLECLNKKWQKEGFPEIRIGIGLNSGDAVIGNMGSYDRFDYTAMGDNINLGSRLESITKQYGVNIVISQATKDKIKNKGFITRKLDLVKVKGKNKPITIYELVCKEGDVLPEIKNKIEEYEKGLELYLQKKWKLAISCFKEVGDFASKEFLKRCEEFIKNPPEKDWDGVWVMKSK